MGCGKSRPRRYDRRSRSRGRAAREPNQNQYRNRRGSDESYRDTSRSPGDGQGNQQYCCESTQVYRYKGKCSAKQPQPQPRPCCPERRPKRQCCPQPRLPRSPPSPDISLESSECSSINIPITIECPRRKQPAPAKYYCGEEESEHSCHEEQPTYSTAPRGGKTVICLTFKPPPRRSC